MSKNKHDISVINRTIGKLSRGRNFLRFFVFILILGLWAWGAYELYKYSQTIDYKPLAQYSDQVVTFLEQNGQYIWIGLIALISLIILLSLISWINGSIRRAGDIIPHYEAVDNLIHELSPEGRKVLAWVWESQREPITIKDLRETKHQLKADRVELLNVVEKEANLLGIIPEHLNNDKNHLLQTNRLMAEKQKVERVLSNVDLNLNKQEDVAPNQVPQTKPNDAIKTAPAPTPVAAQAQAQAQAQTQAQTPTPASAQTYTPVQAPVETPVSTTTKTQASAEPQVQPTVKPIAPTQTQPKAPAQAQGQQISTPGQMMQQAHQAQMMHQNQQAQAVPQYQQQITPQGQMSQEAQISRTAAQAQAKPQQASTQIPSVSDGFVAAHPQTDAQFNQAVQSRVEPTLGHSQIQNNEDVPIATPQTNIPKVNFINNPQKK
ncbi:putative membrane protein [Taylorella asinigenitalis 14/45]|uniref:Putative membrane protein n=1 Tax=Taylorella asinigenitalis 14/45 TaxID=1091495 RepID=I7IL27_9BURK|nr:hypothetical protein [Taylorella asinigenitalis]CCG19718.1 putative membrane protein [Taylorella asinigenitalis 14/45]